MDEKTKFLLKRLLKNEIDRLIENINQVKTKWIEERLIEEKNLCEKTLNYIKNK